MAALLSALAAIVNSAPGLVAVSLATGMCGVWLHLALVVFGGGR